MTVGELKSILNYDNEHDKNDIVIGLSKPSIGPLTIATVKSAYFGFDWDFGRLILNPEQALVVKMDNEAIFDMAQDLIMRIATKLSKRESFETRTAKKILLKVGYTQEQLDGYQHLFHEAP